MSSRAQTITVAIVGDTSRLSKSLTDGQRRVQNFGIAATAALTALGVSSVKAYTEREQAQNRLNYALDKSPKLYDINREALAGYNSSLAETVAIDDDLIAGAEAVLARFAQNEDQLRDLTALSADYARISGTDIVSAAGTVGKALLGNTRALKVLGISYTATGNAAQDAANIQELLNEKIGGFAEDYAGTAAGQAEDLSRRWGEMQETIGEGLLPALEALMDITKPILDAFTSLPKPVQQGVFVLGLLGATAMAVGPRVLALKKIIDAQNITLGTVRTRVTGAATSLKTMGTGWSTAAKGAAAFAAVAAVQSTATGTLGAETMGLNQAIQELGAPSNSDRVGNVFGSIADTIYDGSTVLDDARRTVSGVDTELANLVASGHADQAAAKWAEITEQANELGISTEELNGIFPQYTSSLDGATAASAGFEASQTRAAERVDALTTKVQGLIDQFTILNQGYLDERAAARGFESALNAADAALKDNGRTLNKHTDAGIANQEALDGIAVAGNEWVHSLVAQNASQREVMGAYKQARSELIAQAKQFGMTKAEAKKYADQLLLTPKQIRTKLEAIADKQKVIDYQNQIDQTPGIVTTHFVTTGTGQSVKAPRHAGGGRIRGVGGPRDDANLIWASDDEFIVNAASAQRFGYANLERINRFADGGKVGGGGVTVAGKDGEKLLDKLTELVQTARAHLKELKGQRADYQKGIASGLMGDLTLSGTLADNRDNDAASRLRRFRQDANHIIRFMKQLNRLRKAGLHGVLYNEIRDLGSDEGSIVARQLLADPDTIDGFMNVQRRLDRQTQRFARAAGERKFGDRIDQARDRLEAAERRRDRAAGNHHGGGGGGHRETHVHFHGQHGPADRRAARKLAHQVRGEIERIDRKNGHAKRKNGRRA